MKTLKFYKENGVINESFKGYRLTHWFWTRLGD